MMVSKMPQGIVKSEAHIDVASVEPAQTGLAIQHEYDWMVGTEGNENIGTDVTLPYMVIVQGNTQLKEEHRDLRDGDLFNTLTRQGFNPKEQEIGFVPVKYEKWFIEREIGAGHRPGKVINRYRETDATLNDLQRHDRGYSILNNHGVWETHYHYGLLVIDGLTMPCCIALRSTNISVSRDLNMMCLLRKAPDGRPAPRFSSFFNLGTTKKSKDDNSWWVFSFKPNSGYTPRYIFEEAKVMYQQLMSGAITVDVVNDDLVEYPADASGAVAPSSII